MHYLVPRSFLTLEFGRQTRLADLGYDVGRGFAYHYERELLKLEEIAEALLLCPIVTIGIVGPNVQLAFLAKYFGVSALIRLLDESAIEFKQITGSVSLATEPDGMAYLSQETAFDGPTNSDAEAAAHVGLRRYGSWIPEDQRRDLIVRAARQTNQTRRDAPRDAIEIALEQDPEGARALSTPALGPEARAIEHARRQLVQWATSYCHSSMIYDESYALLNENDDWTFAYEAARACTAHTGIFEAATRVLNKEGVLPFAELIRRGLLAPQDIAALRDDSATDAFRTWLWGEVTDGRDPAEEWLRVHSIRLEDGPLRKISIVTMAVVKTLASGAVKFALGVEGGASGAAIEIAADVVVDNAFDRVVKNIELRSPRHFIDRLTNIAGRRVIQSEVDPTTVREPSDNSDRGDR